MELLVFAMVPLIFGGVIPAIIMVRGRKTPGRMSPTKERVMGVIQLATAAIDLSVARFAYREVNVPGAGQGGLLTLFIAAIGVAGAVLGTLLLITGTLQVVRSRFAIYGQKAIIGVYVAVLVAPFLLVLWPA